MSSYFIKPKEPTVLNHKEYHELSSTNLMVSEVVSLPLSNDVPRSDANSWPRAIGFDCPRDSRDLGPRKIQHRTGRCIVELSAPHGETGETSYARYALDGTPSFPSLACLELTTWFRFG